MRSSKRIIVASTSTNFESSLKGDQGLFLASSSTKRAAAVLPTPGGPYIITCWGLTPHNAERSISMPSLCPTTSSRLVGRVKLDNGSLNFMLRIFFNLEVSFSDS